METLRDVVELKLKDNKMKDFCYTAGKNIGSLNKSKLGKFIGLSHSAINNLEKKHPQRLECLYFGAFCMANNINKIKLVEIVKNTKNI